MFHHLLLFQLGAAHGESMWHPVYLTKRGCLEFVCSPSGFVSTKIAQTTDEEARTALIIDW